MNNILKIVDEVGAIGQDMSKWPRVSGKSKLDKYRPELESLLANGSTQKFIARRYNTTEANLSRWMKKHKLKHAGK